MQKNNKMIRGLLVFVGIIAMTVVVSMMMQPAATGSKIVITMSQFTESVQMNNVESVLVMDDTVYGRYVDHLSTVTNEDLTKDYDFSMGISTEESFKSDIHAIVAKSNSALEADEVTAGDYGFEYDYKHPQEDSLLVILLPYIITIVFFVGLWMLFMKQVQGSNNKAASFGKSRHRMASKEKNDKMFSDVAGAVEEKAELSEIVDFLKDPGKFLALGARIPKGVLLVGPPGTGKTLMAKAVAGEAEVPFFTISGSDFVEMYVGVGASRVRDLFEQAKKASPCIIFIDEIDAVGRHRGSGMGGGHDEREQTLNQLLVEMDGFTKTDSVIVMAATNRQDILDPALLRPGRFDRQITVGFPDVKGREEILVVHSRKKPLAKDVKLQTIARLTPFFTGADLENLMNEAAILAARQNKKKISMLNIKEAITRVQLGPEKKSYKVTERDKKLVAYHEAGHAIVAHYLEHSDPVHEVSIIPRGGGAGGYTQTLASEDNKFMTKAKLLDMLAMSMGGNVAEQLVLGDVSTGSSSDLKHASEIARRMVTEWGMSDSIGPVYLGGQKEIFIGRDLGHSRNYSEQLSARIDIEVHKLLEASKNRALKLVEEHREMMDSLVEVLLVREKLDGAEFAMVMEGKELPPIVEEEVVEEPEVPVKEATESTEETAGETSESNAETSKEVVPEKVTKVEEPDSE